MFEFKSKIYEILNIFSSSVFHNLEKEEAGKVAEQSFFITKQEIVYNNYGLSINRYKKLVYEKFSAILKQIIEIESEFQSGLKELEKF